MTQTPTALPETTLRLHVRNAASQPVPIFRAQLFMEEWGEYEWITLTTESNVLVLSLTVDSLSVPWEDWYGKNTTDCRLYVEAKGYAPVESRPMSFIGRQVCPMDGGKCSPALQVQVEFPGRPPVNVLAGETKDMELTVREVQPRMLRFVDENQTPLPGVQVEAYRFGSAANHCGNPMGAQFVGKGVSDDAGRVAIPDGDYEYLLTLVKPDYAPKPDDDFAFLPVLEYLHKRELRLVSYLSSPEIVIELGKMQRQRLEMIVRKDGKPLVNRTLYGDQWSCTCAMCEVELATTDAQGKISLEFYPEMWESIYFAGKNGAVWQADPLRLPSGQVIQVDLRE